MGSRPCSRSGSIGDRGRQVQEVSVGASASEATHGAPCAAIAVLARDRRRSNMCHVALLSVLVIVGAPDFIHAQNGPRLEIDRALFMVATKGPDGKWSVRETDRVPLRPRDACYGWRLHFSKNTGDEVSWRSEFALPGGPGKEPALLVTNKREKPQGGWIGGTWCVTKGDPVGEHV